MIRLFDIVLALLGLVIGAPVLMLITVIGFSDTGSPFFCQRRVGRKRKPFTLIKFRTMKLDTKDTPSHLASSTSITPFGRFLRRTKLDELPQLWNVLIGDMSIVGPRPCLFSQDELIGERDRRSVYEARPGITGLAQVNNIDMSTPVLLAETDSKMLKSMSLLAYFGYILQTVTGKGGGDGVTGAN